MISITRLAQSKKNLEQDLKRIFDTAKKRAETKQGTMSFPSTRSMEEMALKSIGHDLTEEEKAILQETSAWKAMVRCGKIMDRLSTMLSPLNRLEPPCMAISYDLVVHPFLYEDWRLNYAEIDFTQFDMSLSSSEIYDVFQQCNSDLISVFVSKLDNCSQAEKEHIIAAYENGNREEFIKHLRLLSNEDYRILCLFAYLFHVENSLVSFDEDTLNVLLHVVDFGDEARLSAGNLLPCKEIIDFISFPQDFELKDNPTEEEVVAYFNKISDVFEPYLKNVEAIYSYLKHDLPRVFESMNPFPFERKYLEDLLNDPEVKAILADLSEKPNEDASPDVQEQPKPQPTLAPTEGKKQDGEGGMKKNEDVPHWPTEEELKNYDLNHNDAEFFTESIFGIAKSVKASDVEQLYNVLISKDVQVLDDTLEAKLIFLARYTGRSIPGLELKPLKWCYTASERDKALGYLIKTTAGAKFAKGIRFFYYDDNGQKTKPEREPVAQGGNSWALAGRKETTRTLFERELNKFLIMYPDDKE